MGAALAMRIQMSLTKRVLNSIEKGLTQPCPSMLSQLEFNLRGPPCAPRARALELLVHPCTCTRLHNPLTGMRAGRVKA
jgi:hypothetical protein